MGVLTWGQIRLSLQQTLPGLSLDLVDEFLLARYARVLDHTGWLGLEGTAYIETSTPYQSANDTVTVTQGSASVVGVGTAWSSALTGKKFQVNRDGPLYTFTCVDATHATLDRVYEGTSGSGFSYALFTNIYPLPDDLKEIPEDGVQSADDGYTLTPLSEGQLGLSVGFRNVIGTPSVYAVTISPSSLDGGTTWQIEFYPIPAQQKGYPVRYQRVGTAFDGTNTGASSLPFVSDGVLLAGCRADIWAHAGDGVKAKFYELKFQDELGAMLRADRRKRASRVMRPPQRLTRHRIERLMRGQLPRIPN
jgi:hypothetical protein